MKMVKPFLLALKLLMVSLALGWISIWVLKPTQLWTRKWKAAEDAARTTVFGSSGKILKLEAKNGLKRRK